MMLSVLVYSLKYLVPLEVYGAVFQAEEATIYPVMMTSGYEGLETYILLMSWMRMSTIAQAPTGHLAQCPK